MGVESGKAEVTASIEYLSHFGRRDGKSLVFTLHCCYNETPFHLYLKEEEAANSRGTTGLHTQNRCFLTQKKQMLPVLTMMQTIR
jgi:hypothetical protein